MRFRPVLSIHSPEVHSIRVQLISAVLERRECSTQALVGLAGNSLQFDVLADDAERCHGCHRGHRASAGFGFVHDHVARQQQPNLQFRMQCPICERRIACAEDDVFAKLPIELLFESLLHVDRRQDPKAFRFQRLGCALDRLFICQRNLTRKP